MPTIRWTVLLVWLATALPVLAQSPLGEVAESRGPGRLVAAGAVSTLAAGQALHEGDQVLTGPDAMALLLLTPETRIHLGPDSALTLEPALAGMGTVLTVAGALVFDRPPGQAAQPVTLNTAFGEIGVRGTRFFAGPSRGEFAVFVERGRVEVTAEAVTVVLVAGQGTELVEGRPPSAPAAWGQARIDEAQASVDPGR